MNIIEIHSRDLARSVCAAFIACPDLKPGESIVLGNPGSPSVPWTVQLEPGDEAVTVTAYGAGTPIPEPIAAFTVPYPPGPQFVVLFDRPFCALVADAVQAAFAALEAARGGDGRG